MASSSGNYHPARPKRSGEHLMATHLLQQDRSSKKPRFDPRNPSTLAQEAADEEDVTLEADVIGKGGRIKRNAVNIDGYDSDSSTENFDARAEARGQKKKATVDQDDDDDDDDMFAAEGRHEEPGRSGQREAKKKAPRFLDNSEIEGQDENSKSGGHVAADLTQPPSDGGEGAESSSSSESGDDEARDRVDSDMDEELGAGGKKRNAPKLDAFNMRAEQEEGRFDEAGNFVRKAYDPDAGQDVWLEGISKREMRRAKEAQDKREVEQKARERAEDSIATSEVLASLIAQLDVGETAMEALVRYGKAAAAKKGGQPRGRKVKKKSELMDVDMDVAVDPVQEATARQARAAIDSITECASRLSERGVEDAYELGRELLMRRYQRETGEAWRPRQAGPVQWHFHWLAAAEEDIHGPYDGATMQAWKQDGHFAAGAEFRRVGESQWSERAEFEE